MQVDGIVLRLYDTAGIHDNAEGLEARGIDSVSYTHLKDILYHFFGEKQIKKGGCRLPSSLFKDPHV